MKKAHPAEAGDDPLDAATPSEADTAIAADSALKLAQVLVRGESVRIRADDERGAGIPLPQPAVRLLAGILEEMAKGNALSIRPVHRELTTQQAANQLNVSRPFLIKLIEEGRIPCRKVGRHRRILQSDLDAFRRRCDVERLEALKSLVAEGEDLGLGY